MTDIEALERVLEFTDGFSRRTEGVFETISIGCGEGYSCFFVIFFFGIETGDFIKHGIWA